MVIIDFIILFHNFKFNILKIIKSIICIIYQYKIIYIASALSLFFY